MTDSPEIKLNIWHKLGIYVIIQILVFDILICIGEHSFFDNIPIFFQIINGILVILLGIFWPYLVFLIIGFIAKCIASMRLQLSFETIKRISERKCNYDDIKELISGLNYKKDKKRTNRICD